MASATALAKEIVDQPRDAVRMTKALLRRAPDIGLDATLELSAAMNRCATPPTSTTAPWPQYLPRHRSNGSMKAKGEFSAEKRSVVAQLISVGPTPDPT